MATPPSSIEAEDKLWIEYSTLKGRLEIMRKRLMETRFAPEIKAENPKMKKAAAAKPSGGGVGKPKKKNSEKKAKKKSEEKK
jgi:hypothetical protein